MINYKKEKKRKKVIQKFICHNLKSIIHIHYFYVKYSIKGNTNIT